MSRVLRVPAQRSFKCLAEARGGVANPAFKGVKDNGSFQSAGGLAGPPALVARVSDPQLPQQD